MCSDRLLSEFENSPVLSFLESCFIGLVSVCVKSTLCCLAVFSGGLESTHLSKDFVGILATAK